MAWPALQTLGWTALIVALGSTLLFRAAGADLATAFGALAIGGFGSWHAWTETLTRATPMMLTGLSVAVAFRAKLASIGAEGQLFAGAILGYWAATAIPAPPLALVPLVLIAGFAGGAAWAGLAALLKLRRGVDEVMSTVMLNYVAQFGLSYLLLNGVWSDPASSYEQSPMIPGAASFPLLIAHSRLHIGLLVALAACTVVQIVLTRTSLGYDIRVLGENPRAFAAKIGRPDRLVLLVMAVSGGLAGLAGVGEVFGVHHRLLPGLSPGLGYTGIIIAILARLHPGGIILASILIGGIVNAAIKLQILAGVPSAAASVIQALLLLAFLVAGTLARRRHVG